MNLNINRKKAKVYAMNNEKEEWETGLNDLLNSYDFQDLSGIGEKEISQLKAFIHQQIEQAKREGYMEAVEQLSSGFVEWYNSKYDDQSAGILYKSWIEAFLKAKLNK